MFFLGVAIDQDVVDISGAEHVQHALECVIDEVPEGGWGVG